METRNICKVQLLQFFLIISFAINLHASDPIFYESFNEPFKGRWIVSQKEDYNGVWKHEKSEGHDDYGLLVSEKARKYAIVKELEKAVELKEKTVVLQFETRCQTDLECGGAYLKYLRPQEAGWVPKQFDNGSPYSIMFGPDKCGFKNKVHFILKHKNPISGEYTEHHLKSPPPFPVDKLTHVYTAILTPDNVVRILVDGEVKKKANFLSDDDFEPAIIPPKMILDPKDIKPADWDDREKIPNLNATKPEDWDEDAPFEIVDEEAEKPEGWLDDEPVELDDPESVKPDDWDDEEDGEWEALKMDNPKCTEAPGCGEWKKPMKKNPAYKGKWIAPEIDNPAYKGIWKPRDIPNPNYFEVSSPNFEPIAAVGIEIWTIQDGILFDNILIAGDEKTAQTYRQTQWKPKFDAEKEKQKAEEAAAKSSEGLPGIQKIVFDLLRKVADVPLLETYRPKILELIEKAEAQPNAAMGVFVSIAAVLITLLFKILVDGTKTAASSPKSVAPKSSRSKVSAEEKEGGNEKEGAAAAAPPKKTSHED